jgi:hypothetical protein
MLCQPLRAGGSELDNTEVRLGREGAENTGGLRR